MTVVVTTGDASSRAELDTALRRTHPEIPIVDLGGLAVSEALALPAVAGSTHLWFLTPDSRPDPDCLDELLEAIGATESIAAVGPKIMHAERIVSAGVTTTAAGERFNPVGTGEIDQGQRDAQLETLGLDLPGMLIATADLERVGAPSRSLDPAHRGLEYSRRFRDLGRRVVLAPGAQLEISASHAVRLGSSARPPLSKSQVRAEQRYRLSLARPSLPLLICLLALTRLGDAVLGLLANDVRAASWHLAALVGLGTDARVTARVRRANARRARMAGRGGTAHLSALFADADELEMQRRSMHAPEHRGAEAADESRAPAAPDDADLHQVGDTEEELDSFSRLEVSGGPGLLRHPLTYLVAAAALLSGFLSHRLFGPGHLSGGALGSTDVSFGALLNRLLTEDLDVSTGAQVPADPYHVVLTVLSLPFLGNVDLMVRTLLLLAPILAVIAAHSCARIVVKRTWVRALAALLWIAAPVFTSAVSSGRLGVVIVWITAPLFVLAVRRSLRTGSTAAAATAGLLLFVIIAGSPLLLIAGLLLTALLLIRGHGARHVWLLVPTLALGWPWLVGLLREPGALFAMPGQTLAPPAPPTYLLALGFPSDVDLSWLAARLADLGVTGTDAEALGLWVPLLFLPMLLLAFLTLIEARLKLTRLLWAVGLCLSGLLLATLQILIPAQVGPFHLIGSYPLAGLTLLGLGAVMLLAMGADRTTAKPTSARRLPLRSLSGLVAVAAVVLIVVEVGTATTSRPVVRAEETGRIPALAADRAAGETRARTLALDDVDGEVLASLIATVDETVVGTSTIRSAQALRGWPWERRPQPIGDDQVLVAQAAAALSAGDAGDVRDLLTRLGVDFVLVDGEASDLQNSVGSSAGLVQVGPTESGMLWQVDKPASGRYLIREADGSTSTARIGDDGIEVPPGGDGRSLVVATSVDGLTARLDGVDLPRPDTDDWAAVFSLPESGGTVDLESGSPLHAAGVIAGFVVGIICLLAAIPFGSRARRPARRAADTQRPSGPPRPSSPSRRGDPVVRADAGTPPSPDTPPQGRAAEEARP
ncbi:hypothetical protein DFO66_10381 [Brevibacterium sanguinis]|uniref:GT2 family glycosyltransferase n=2 Tax=Brevibacterium TaxID=1696 RepID=A0A366IN67_9MICO|nr:hypothetical protein DFO66_10381 [Brevibacterium sanguinis]RBP72789.1 hypothetical protein DFO65_10380 [Brevibacterium celere]